MPRRRSTRSRPKSDAIVEQLDGAKGPKTEPVPFPFERKPQVPSWFQNYYRKAEVPLDHVIATQTYVTTKGVKLHKKTKPINDVDLPLVYRTNDDRYFVADGHHRLVAALKSGHKQAMARVIDIGDPDNPMLQVAPEDLAPSDRGRRGALGLAPLRAHRMKIRVYHGTRNASAILREGFRPSTGGEFGPGIYFSENPDTAAWYAEHVAHGPEAPTILSTEVDLKNPFTVRKVDWIKKTEKRTPKTVQRTLQRKGHDSIIGVALNDHERQIVVLDPTDIIGQVSILKR